MEFIRSYEQVPVLHVRGSYYAVGHSIGKTHGEFIRNYVGTLDYLRDVVFPIYATEEGRRIYDSSLALCERKFPQYVQEMKGMADGAEIPFHKLFLLHIENMIAPTPIPDTASGISGDTTSTVTDKPNSAAPGAPSGTSLFGCSCVICNHDEMVLGHTEDASPEILHQFFIVSAQIVNEKGETLEKFSSLTWPGYLPGYTMGYNHHGFVYSCNTICPNVTYADRTPLNFITRAILAARDEEEVIRICKDSGTGIADGFSLNMFFVKKGAKVEDAVACNIEVGPNRNGGDESELDILWVKKGADTVHCNKYLRLDLPQQVHRLESTNRRHKAIEKNAPPTSFENVKKILSDTSDKEFPVFRTALPRRMAVEGAKDKGATVAVGLFDIKKRTWSIYNKPPSESSPVVELPIVFSF